MSELQNETLTFEKVWAALMENREQMKETSKMIQENAQRQKETDQMMKETDRQMKETALRFKETDRLIGSLGNRFGDLAEHLVAPGIVEKFNSLGFRFTRTARDAKFKDPKTMQTLAEVDIFLENGDIVIAVEVKSTLRTKDVDEHLERMDNLRRVADLRGDKRKYRGALAGAITADEARNYALKAGFYVIVQSGDTMKFDIPEGFVPKDW